MLNEGSVDKTCLKDLWDEALRERQDEERSESFQIPQIKSSLLI